MTSDGFTWYNRFMPTYFIYASDLVSVLVGPFSCWSDATAHVEFCDARGDAADMKVIDAATAEESYADLGIIDPAEDRAFDVEACIRRVTGR